MRNTSILLFTKNERLNVTQTVEKQTPKGDLSWYIKWLASFFIIAAVCFRSAGADPIYDLVFSVLGTTGWATVGILWHDRAIMMLNGILSVILVVGIISYYGV